MRGHGRGSSWKRGGLGSTPRGARGAEREAARQMGRLAQAAPPPHPPTHHLRTSDCFRPSAPGPCGFLGAEQQHHGGVCVRGRRHGTWYAGVSHRAQSTGMPCLTHVPQCQTTESWLGRPGTRRSVSAQGSHEWHQDASALGLSGDRTARGAGGCTPSAHAGSTEIGWRRAG